jgi:iron complex transport system substrate-binding protein
MHLIPARNVETSGHVSHALIQIHTCAKLQAPFGSARGGKTSDIGRERQRYLAARSALSTVFLLVLVATCAWARTLTDELGRRVTLADHPHRVVCLAPSLTDTVYALRHGSDVVGITDYTVYPAEARHKPSIGGVVDPSLEAIVALNPDLVLTITPLNGYDTMRALERLHIPVFAVEAKGLEGAYRSIGSVGSALNDAAGAAALVRQLRLRQEKAAARMRGKPRPEVLLVLWPDPFITAGRGAFVTDLIEAAGAHSVTADIPQEWSRVSLEAIVSRRPKYLLLVRGSSVTVDQLQKLPGWSSLEAVREHRVIWVDDRIYYPSPLMLDALEDLSRQLVAAETSKEAVSNQQSAKPPANGIQHSASSQTKGF